MDVRLYHQYIPFQQNCGHLDSLSKWFVTLQSNILSRLIVKITHLSCIQQSNPIKHNIAIF